MPLTLSCGAVSTHSRLKAAETVCPVVPPPVRVSTHSRLKAADPAHPRCSAPGRFNTQPPKGGWHRYKGTPWAIRVSTHSRLKAADTKIFCGAPDSRFQHTAA